MVKVKTTYVCSACGADSAKWIGNCPSCGAWNTYHEEQVVKEKRQFHQHTWPLSPDKVPKSVPKTLPEISTGEAHRVKTGDDELDRVLGGGMVPGSLTLIGGHPGIGKSTLLLQVATRWQEVSLYVSGEESTEQIKLRADRIGGGGEKCYVLAETNLDAIVGNIRELRPTLVIIDSIQTERISPERPTSPAKQWPGGTVKSSNEEIIATTTAKSMAGSVTLIPPAIFKKTSDCPKKSPHRFSSTASNM